MARGNAIKVLRTTRANLDTQAGLSGLLAGEPYLITDEGRFAVATSASAYVAFAKQAEARPSFSAYKSSNQTGIATATWTKLTFGTEEWDVGGYYDTSTSRFTPPAGKYDLKAGYFFSAGVADTGYGWIGIYKNGALLKEVRDNASGVDDGSYISALVDANGTDYFEAYCYGATVSSLTVVGSQTRTFFQGIQV